MRFHLEVAGERGPEGGENFMDGVKEAKGEVDAHMTQRSQVCQHFDLGLPASRMVRSHYLLAKLLQPMDVPPQTFQYSRTQLEGHGIIVPFPKARDHRP